MFNTMNFTRRALRGGTALQALALLGAGVGMLAVAAPAAAQDYSQVNATGRVQGTNGTPIAGATVRLKSNAQGFERTTTTDSGGNFRVNSLPQGSYTFTIEAPNFETLTDPNVGLTQAAAANQFTLAVAGGAADGDIVVTAGRIQTVDISQNTTGAVINVADTASRVPVSRDITSIALLAPATSLGDTTFGNLPSINGASVSENVYYINGLNITQFRNGLGAVPVPFDFYQSTQIQTGALAAEFGRTTGGVINSTTKSGSNEFHGGVLFNWLPDELRADSPNTYASDNDSVYSTSKDFIAQLSGPIIKDHLFFYGLYQSRDVQSGGGTTGVVAPGVATSPATAATANNCAQYPTACAPFGPLAFANQVLVGTGYTTNRNRSPFYGGKLDAVIVDGQRLEATYFNTSNTQIQRVYGTSQYSLASGLRYNPNTNSPGGYVATNVYRGGGENYVFRYTGTFTDWLTLSGAYGVNKNRDTTESSNPDLPSIVDSRGASSLSIGNTLANANLNFDKRTFYRGDANLTVRLLGTHNIRGGYDREDLDLSTQIAANGGGQLTYITAGGVGAPAGGIDAVSGLPNGTQYLNRRTFISGGEFQTRNEAAYIQDAWSLFNNRLLLNLGLRYDTFVNRNADGEAFFRSGDLWSPRLGFNFDPSGQGRSRIYGSFSRYYLPVAVNTNVRLAGSELDFDSYFRLLGTNADGTPIIGAPVTTYAGAETCPDAATVSCVVRNDGTVPGTGSTVASNLKAQSTDEYILGGEYRFGSRIKVGAFFTYTKLNNSLEDGALDQAIIPYCVSQGNTLASCRAIWNGVHQYALINPGQPVTVQLSDPLPNRTSIDTVTLSADALGYAQAQRKYRAMTFTFDREYDGKWDLHLYYTYSKLVGNIEGGVRSDNGQTDAGLTTAFDLPGLVNGSYGYLPNDQRHNIKLFGSYQISKLINLGAQFQVQSPRHYGCIGRVPALADGNLAGRFYGAAGFYCNVVNGQVVTYAPTTPGFVFNNPTTANGTTPSLQLTPRGRSFQSEWLYNLNLDVAIKVPTDAFDGTLRLSVFNVLNLSQERDYNEVGTATAGTPNLTYGLPTVYQPPRSFRIQFGVNF